MCYSGRLCENGSNHDDYILSRWAVSGVCHSPSACVKQASCTVPFPLQRAGREKDCSCCIFILFDLSRVLFHMHTLKFVFPSVNVILISFYFGSRYYCNKKLFILCPTIFSVEAEIQHVSWRRAVWGKLGAHTSRLDLTEILIVVKNQKCIGLGSVVSTEEPKYLGLGWDLTEI